MSPPLTPVPIAKLEQLLELAGRGLLTLSPSDGVHADPASTLLKELLLLALLGAECRDHAASGRRTRIGDVVKDVNHRLRRFA